MDVAIKLVRRKERRNCSMLILHPTFLVEQTQNTIQSIRKEVVAKRVDKTAH